MSKLDELERLADEAALIPLLNDSGEETGLAIKGRVYIESDELSAMIQLMRQMRKALYFTNINGFCAEESCHMMEKALDAFDKFDKVE